MALTIEMTGPGGPEVLQAREVGVGDPGPDEVRIRQTVIGVNFVDIYFRSGLYSPPSLPAVLGLEGRALSTPSGKTSPISSPETGLPMPACRSAATLKCG